MPEGTSRGSIQVEKLGPTTHKYLKPIGAELYIYIGIVSPEQLHLSIYRDKYIYIYIDLDK